MQSQEKNKGRFGQRQRENTYGIEEKVLQIKRVSKKTRGGNYISFSALVAVGDHKGQVGIGLQRGLEVPQAIKKAIRYARKRMISVPLYSGTLPHDVKVNYKSAAIILRPAPKGAGLKAGSVVRSILNLVGVTDASAKIIGSRNQLINTYATILALKMLKKRE